MSALEPLTRDAADDFTPTAYVRAVLNILEDFGEEKGRLEQTQKAILNILDDLEAEKRSAQDANRMKSEFLANMSHELRTPLNAIMGFTKLMAHGKVGTVSPQQQEFLEDLLKSSTHLQLINDVLDLAKVEAGRMEFHPEPVHLKHLVDEVRNTPGRGTSLKVYLPRADAAQVVATRAPATQPRGGTQTVLVVEDEDVLRKLTRKLLTARLQRAGRRERRRGPPALRGASVDRGPSPSRRSAGRSARGSRESPPRDPAIIRAPERALRHDA